MKKKKRRKKATEKGKETVREKWIKRVQKRSILENMIKVEYYDVNHPTPLDMKLDDRKA